ncbi:FK506 suppressor Sfk1, putative [Talaromyces stipitatus ATCC 10500]|uniref:FK506 suppressor Sfk1, putative n=1 Tax=Talaromyces stipitatus (strain ATCC 10500 / CBS 375.48 / QM 6759 / NRRL 1006) TaxID=441959 RepID=B8MKF8_TALSN|nr:FK506 suppressor Sfk1, putative [Talaromyces stipitatus ATCC 10500]EED15313.1 FK506 suppressor Sfk1, putative [Talaromyces stipitatus ATCC 10500]
MWIISFWVFPVISACMWLAMLVAMISTWAAKGKPHYSNMPATRTIPYISDIGATGIQPLFIAGSAVTVVFLDLSFLSERWLRHTGKLVRNKGRFDKACSILSILFSIAGAAGLILLSIFDDVHHRSLHDAFLGLFIGAYLISAVFICMEYLRLGVTYRRQHRILFISFWIKFIFIVVELALAIAFGVLNQHDRGARNAAAVIEWVIALVFTFYVLSFIIDLLPSVRTRHHIPQGEKAFARPSTSSGHPEITYEEPVTTDSMGDRANTYRGPVASGYQTNGANLPRDF